MQLKQCLATFTPAHYCSCVLLRREAGAPLARSQQDCNFDLERRSSCNFALHCNQPQHFYYFLTCREAVAPLARSQQGYLFVTWANDHYWDFVQTWMYHVRRNNITGAYRTIVRYATVAAYAVLLYRDAADASITVTSCYDMQTTFYLHYNAPLQHLLFISIPTNTFPYNSMHSMTPTVQATSSAQWMKLCCSIWSATASTAFRWKPATFCTTWAGARSTSRRWGAPRST